MDTKQNLIILDKDEKIYDGIKEKFNEWNIYEYNIHYLKNLSELKEVKFSYLVIDEEYVSDFEQLKWLHSISGKCILLVDKLNHKYGGMSMMEGIELHYRHSPINSLSMKILGKNPLVRNKASENKKKIKNGKGKVVSVMSAAGGTGKSTIAINAGIHIAKKGKKVLLIDFSTFSSIPVKLKIKADNRGIDSVVSEIEREDERSVTKIIKEKLKENIHRFEMKEAHMDVIYSDSPLKSEKVDGKAVECLIEAAQVLGYDLIIIDTSDELNEKNIAVAELSDEILLCASSDIGVGWKLIKFKEILDHIQISHKCKLVINKYNRKAAFSCKQLSMELNLPWAGIIPFSNHIQYSDNHGVPIALSINGVNKNIKGISNEILPLFDKREMRSWKRYS
ncbi:AAA family ATPase [Oceanirhabdus sp. W0125-5]|uniref:AAA family ATPase n=1 Tax=Oceanirhabdus sp. W0125-5 TaxID=2999116 RepID=UPI0022F2FCCF|nr:AAA family ATPase [Oceanirhabdus sp. W0125-5]WBW95957.1 AAA family ATPase [Oceanirhabdus sp. W0125-5]